MSFLSLIPFFLQANTPLLNRFDINDFNLEDVIGRGQFSVYRGTVGGKLMAVKKIDCHKNKIPQEVEVQSSIRPHPNVLPLLGVAHSNDGFTLYICMELADMSLHQYLHKGKNAKPSLQQSTKWAVQIARGIRHIHQQGLAHCDLKSANVLLFKKGDNAKVCDFGSARILERTTTVTTMAGTYRWMAPEFNDKAVARVNQLCDSFSYGMILFELYAHEIPYSDMDDVTVAYSVRDGRRPPIPPDLPLHIKNLMQSCWEHTPRERPTFENILQVCLIHLHVGIATYL